MYSVPLNCTLRRQTSYGLPRPNRKAGNEHILSSPSALARLVLPQGTLSCCSLLSELLAQISPLSPPASSLTGPALSPFAVQCYGDSGCCSSYGNSGLPESSLYSEPCLPCVPVWALHTVGVYNQSRSRVRLTQKPPAVASLHPCIPLLAASGLSGMSSS